MRGLVSKHHDLRNCRVWTVRLSQGPADTSSLVSRHHGLRVWHFGGPLCSTYSSNECESEEHTLTQMDCSLLTTLATFRVRKSVFHSLGCAHLRGGLSKWMRTQPSFKIWGKWWTLSLEKYPWFFVISHNTDLKALRRNHGVNPHLELGLWPLLPTPQKSPWQSQHWHPLSNDREKWGALFIVLVQLTFKIPETFSFSSHLFVVFWS